VNPAAAVLDDVKIVSRVHGYAMGLIELTRTLISVRARSTCSNQRPDTETLRKFFEPRRATFTISRLATEYPRAGTSPEADIPIGVPALLGSKLGLPDRPVKQSEEAE
jgi:hypothetical protein